MAINITTKRILNTVLPAWPPYIIQDFEYPARKVIDPIEFGTEGAHLPKGNGFPFNFEPPSLSFKCYRAMVNQGLAESANYAIRNFKRSYITPEAIWNGVAKFSHPLPKKLVHPAYDRALAEVSKELGSKKIIPYSLDFGVKSLPQNTSPGLPFINKTPGLKKGEVYQKYRKAFLNHWDRVGKGQPVAPLPDCAAFARSHISTPDVNKVRPVWAYPMMAVSQESRFAAPLIKELTEQRCGHHTAYGCEMMKGGMTWLNGQASLASARYPGAKFLMTDYSGFDATVPAWLIRDIFNIIEAKIDFSQEYDGQNIHSVDPNENRRKFRKLVSYFINTPIQNCDGRRFQKNHGVPSGSMFTNILDTFANMVLSRVLIDVCCGPESIIFDIYFGDDGMICIYSDVKVNINDLSRAALDIFGMILNPKKSYYTTRCTNIHFLGYFNYYGSPYKKSGELIASLLFPQYLKDDWGYCISRALGCALASAGMSSEVYLAAHAVYIFTIRRENKFEEGINILKTNPRAQRHLSQMGCGDIPLTDRYFKDINALVPRLDCTKLLQNCNLVP